MSSLTCPKCGSNTRQRKDSPNSYRCVNKKCSHTFKPNPIIISNDVKSTEKLESPKIKTSQFGLSLHDFRLRTDFRYMVTQGVKKLDGQHVLSTVEFAQLCGMPMNIGMSKIEDLSGFDEYRGTNRGKTYWSHPSVISQFKQEGILL